MKGTREAAGASKGCVYCSAVAASGCCCVVCSVCALCVLCVGRPKQQQYMASNVNKERGMVHGPWRKKTPCPLAV